jgi:tripartite-type tricarboxylate transporter receptor subunit TctC
MSCGTWARCIAVAFLAVCTASAQAQSPAEFYKGRTIDLLIGYSEGGGYDRYARLIARYLGKHIPGQPVVVPRNMEGTGSLRLANWLYNSGSSAGTVIGAVGRSTGFAPLLGQKTAQFDGTRFNWIGSANNDVSVCVAWRGRTPIKTFDDLLTNELKVGGTGVAANSERFTRVINGVLGTKMKIVSGYSSGKELNRAMVQGEVDGRCGWAWANVKATRPDWVRDGKIITLVQLALKAHPDLPRVPLIVDMAKTEDQKAMLKLLFARQELGRPFLAPPDVPADRVAALRQAFVDTMSDAQFLAQAQKAQIEITPTAGTAVQRLVEEVYRTRPALVRKAMDLLE